ncbi:hypothetical protein VUR80DRAFT_4120 [Thermomyces stellatus]
MASQLSMSWSGVLHPHRCGNPTALGPTPPLVDLFRSSTEPCSQTYSIGSPQLHRIVAGGPRRRCSARTLSHPSGMAAHSQALPFCHEPEPCGFWVFPGRTRHAEHKVRLGPKRRRNTCVEVGHRECVVLIVLDSIPSLGLETVCRNQLCRRPSWFEPYDASRLVCIKRLSRGVSCTPDRCLVGEDLLTHGETRTESLPGNAMVGAPRKIPALDGPQVLSLLLR